MANIVPESWRDGAFREGEQDGAFREGEQDASEQSTAEVLAAGGAETTSSRKAQHRLGKLVNRVRYDRYVASLE